MALHNFYFFVLVVVLFALGSCAVCFSGGELEIKKNHVYSKCGLLNGVNIREIKVDSFVNNVPTVYKTVKSASLRRKGASPNNDPKRLYFDKDCKEVYIWSNNDIVDTLKETIKFKKETWYLFHSQDAHTDIFMFVDKTGKRFLNELRENVVNL